MTAPSSDMTTRKHRQRYVLPDPPEREPEDMTSFKHLGENGNVHHLIQHFGNREATVFGSEKFLSSAPRSPAHSRRIPDLLISFNAKPELYDANNGYVISEQGKAPDFVLEVASPSTGREDVGRKRDDYAAMGILEYWRFDETGEFHGTRLAGDRLVDGAFQTIPIETLEEGVLQGYCEALNLFLRWDHSRLGWYDPDTGRHIVTFDDERLRADAAGARVAEEQRARLAAEARVRELEAELARRDAEG